MLQVIEGNITSASIKDIFCLLSDNQASKNNDVKLVLKMKTMPCNTIVKTKIVIIIITIIIIIIIIIIIMIIKNNNNNTNNNNSDH